ncbi:MAG: tetratricopeptide repeat protein [Chloroflexi bacterium]|nr:tetratricopeptide repeat protein [Chloroflexota bacterium]
MSVRARKLGGMAVVLVLAALLVWLAGSGLFRQPAFKPAPRPTPAATARVTDEDMAAGDAAFERGDYADAIAAYGRAIECNPASAEAHNNRAYAYMTVHEYERALADLDRALQLRPAYINALVNRGDIYNYYYRIDHARGIEDYNRALQLDPAHSLALGHRAIANFYGGDWPAVLADTVRAMRAGLQGETPDY